MAISGKGFKRRTRYMCYVCMRRSILVYSAFLLKDDKGKIDKEALWLRCPECVHDQDHMADSEAERKVCYDPDCELCQKEREEKKNVL